MRVVSLRLVLVSTFALAFTGCFERSGAVEITDSELGDSLSSDPFEILVDSLVAHRARLEASKVTGWADEHAIQLANVRGVQSLAQDASERGWLLASDQLAKERIFALGHAQQVALPPTAPRSLVQGVQDLLMATGGALTPAQTASLVAKGSSLPNDLELALGQVVSSFARVHQLAREGLDGKAEWRSDLLAQVLAARTDFLSSVVHLVETRNGLGDFFLVCLPPFSIPGILSIEVSLKDPACATTYPGGAAADDFHLLIDMEGDDTYFNNAGGSNVGSACGSPLAGAAALVDLDGSDEYRPVDAFGNRRACGANGGGYGGVGILLNMRSGAATWGTEVFAAAGEGTNGGGFMNGLGFLYSDGSSGLYSTSLGPSGGLPTGPADHGVNGGAGDQSYGALVDVTEDDVYTTGSYGTNGGGDDIGVGLLLDVGGQDSYGGYEYGTNGGGASGGHGALLDLACPPGRIMTRNIIGYTCPDDHPAVTPEVDSYNAESHGANGGTFDQGTAFLFDQWGDDMYVMAHGCGVNGGSAIGTSVLLDLEGDDEYHSQLTGSLNLGGINGGATAMLTSPAFCLNNDLGVAAAFLVDGQGDDIYDSYANGTNGGAYCESMNNVASVSGYVADLGGSNEFTADDFGTNGGAYNPLLNSGCQVHGFLGVINDLGTSFTAGDYGTNGGKFAGQRAAASAALVSVSVAANNFYTAGSLGPTGTNGASEGSAGGALLLDRGGTSDSFSDWYPGFQGVEPPSGQKGNRGLFLNI